jgi:hypothetical protein
MASWTPGEILIHPNKFNIDKVVRIALAGLFFLAAAPEIAPDTCTAYAQDSRRAKRAFKAGKKAYAEGNFVKAAELFKEAYGHDAKPAILFNIGQSYKDAGSSQEALNYFARYLNEVPEAPNRETVQETIFELQQLMAGSLATITVDGPEEGLDVFIDDDPAPRCQTPCIITLDAGVYTVGLDYHGDILTKGIEPETGGVVSVLFTAPSPQSGSLVLRSNIEGGMVTIDGQDYGTFPLGPISLEPGIYPVTIEVDGEIRWTGTAEIRADETTEIDASGDSPSLPVPTDPGPTESTGALTVAGYSLIGLGAGALAAGGMFGLSASSIESDLQGQMSRGERPNAELIAQGETQSLYANVFYGVGAIAFTTGIALYLLDEEPGAGTPSTGITPVEGGAIVHTAIEF